MNVKEVLHKYFIATNNMDRYKHDITELLKEYMDQAITKNIKINLEPDAPLYNISFHKTHIIITFRWDMMLDKDFIDGLCEVALPIDLQINFASHSITLDYKENN